MLFDGHWLSVRRNDPRAYALFRRHYSAQKNWKWRAAGNTNILGPGECMVLLSQCGRALFAWQYNTVDRCWAFGSIGLRIWYWSQRA